MRLTEKRDGFYYDTDECMVSNCSQKLGQLEDLMEKYDFGTVEDLDNFIQSCINRIEYENKKEKYL